MGSVSVEMFDCFKTEGPVAEPFLKTRLTACYHTRHRLTGNRPGVEGELTGRMFHLGELCKVTWADRGKSASKHQASIIDG